MSRTTATNTLRIIGGNWRGRKVSFPDAPDLRPTADRVRETVFNWLQADVPGAACFEPFAGSGALSLEALSRGAASVTLMDRAPAVTRHLARELERLGADPKSYEITTGDALTAIRTRQPHSVDILFLDPPFSMDLRGVIETIDNAGILARDAHVYLEAGSDLAGLSLPAGWVLVRAKRAGNVFYGICAVTGQ